jgi:hypothetical protein
MTKNLEDAGKALRHYVSDKLVAATEQLARAAP